jgi:hypothetical protein
MKKRKSNSQSWANLASHHMRERSDNFNAPDDFNAHGYGAEGYDAEGFDINGFDDCGYDRQGVYRRIDQCP